MQSRKGQNHLSLNLHLAINFSFFLQNQKVIYSFFALEKNFCLRMKKLRAAEASNAAKRFSSATHSVISQSKHWAEHSQTRTNANRQVEKKRGKRVKIKVKVCHHCTALAGGQKSTTIVFFYSSALTKSQLSQWASELDSSWVGNSKFGSGQWCM